MLEIQIILQNFLQITDVVFWLLVNEKVILIISLDENQ